MLLLGQGAVLAQVAEHVFHVDNRIVHERADGNCHAAEAHRVDGESEEVEREQRNDEREGNGDERDHGGAHVHEEEQEHDDYEDAAFEKRVFHVVDRAVDEAFLAVNVGRDAHVGRQRGFEFRERGVDLFGEGERARFGLFRHGHHHARLAAQRCDARFRRAVADFHGGNVAQRHCRAARSLHQGG